MAALNSISFNVYVRNVSLRLILIDGWAMGFLPEQTIREASNAGYSRCVVEPIIASVWAYMDAEVHRVELSRLKGKLKAQPSMMNFPQGLPNCMANKGIINMITIIHGPMGCGKTKNAEDLRQLYGAKRIVDDWNPNIQLFNGDLALTNYHREEIFANLSFGNKGSNSVVVVSFESAMVAMKDYR